MGDKIKRGAWLDKTTLIYLFTLIFVSLSSFGLGRLSIGDNTDIHSNQKASTYIPETEGQSYTNYTKETKKSSAISNTNNSSKEGNYLASKNGKLYYTRGCKASNRIKEENRVWFDTASDAEKSGYNASASCK